jgi:hypothetical protein
MSYIGVYKGPKDMLDPESWELSHLETLDPWIRGPHYLPLATDNSAAWEGDSQPGYGKAWRYKELLAAYGPTDVQTIPEVRRLLEVIWELG